MPTGTGGSNEFGLQRPSANGRLYASNEFDLEGPSANGRPAPTEKYSPRRRRPTPGAQAPQKADFNRREGLRPMVGFMRRMNSTLRAFSQRSAYADRKILFASAQADARRASASEGRFQSAQSLRPAVGLRRPKNTLRVGAGRRPARKRLRRPISIGVKPSANGRLVRRMNSASRGLRPTVGLRRPKNTLRVGEGRRPARQRLRRPISIGVKPSANGRPAPTEKYSSHRRRPTPGAQAPQKADSHRREGLRPAVGLCAE